MRHFGTHGPVNTIDNYVVARTERLDDFIKRIKLGRYIVLFAPRQMGKTTFFQDAIAALEAEGTGYFPIHVNFEEYEELTPDSFYANLTNDLRIAISKTLQARRNLLSAQLTDLLENLNITDNIAMRRFFEKLPTLLTSEKTELSPPRIVLIIDEFDGVPEAAAKGFLRSLRRIYLSGREVRCPYSVGIVNGLEDEYLPEDGPIDFTGYITETGHLQMHRLIENFKNFIARAGFRVLQVPDTPQEFVGQYLLFAYLDEFVRIVRATMHLEVPTGRGRTDLIIGHQGQKYIIETKVWRNARAYEAGKRQLATYLTLEDEREGYYIVFDYRQKSDPRIETDTVDGCTIRSYLIRILQDVPSTAAQ